jgi:hypothetical protein
VHGAPLDARLQRANFHSRSIRPLAVRRSAVQVAEFSSFPFPAIETAPQREGSVNGQGYEDHGGVTNRPVVGMGGLVVGRTILDTV